MAVERVASMFANPVGTVARSGQSGGPRPWIIVIARCWKRYSCLRSAPTSCLGHL